MQRKVRNKIIFYIFLTNLCCEFVFLADEKRLFVQPGYTTVLKYFIQTINDDGVLKKMGVPKRKGFSNSSSNCCGFKEKDERKLMEFHAK